MSAQDILAELPRLSVKERELVAEALHTLAVNKEAALFRPMSQARQADLHVGAWEVAADFDAPLPDAFWLGADA